jgi:ribonuclease HI
VTEFRQHSSWLVGADAGPGGPSPLVNNWGAIVYAWLIHRGATDAIPRAAGANYVKRLSTNRGEFMAVLSGLRCLRDGLEVHTEWERGPVIVLTDSMLVINVMTGAWAANLMRGYRDAIEREADWLEARTGTAVQFVHAGDGESERAHKLVRMYARERDRQATDHLWP